MTNHSPAVDIVIPVYNGASHLRETLATIEQQAYPNLFVYVVDDCSSDETASILAEHISRFPLKIIRHSQNRGLSAARNSGIAAGNGQYLAILDADDLWRPAKIAKQVELFESSDSSVGIVSADFQVIDEHGFMPDDTVYDYCRDVTPLTRQLLVLGNVVSGGSAALIKRECVDRCGGFDESLSACEDWEMWHRIAATYSIRILREPLVLVRRHSQSMQGDTPRMLRNRIEVFRRFASDSSSRDLATSCLFQECVAAFRYLPKDLGRSYEASMAQLRVLAIDTGAVPETTWRSAHRRYQLTSTLFSLWRGLDERFAIKDRVRRQPVLSRLYRAMRWRMQALLNQAPK
ncbi:MAG: glycosyltransferase [Cyanobacteriota bacterium]|nr:glycosyltransferase [Cyanobacteriota bacterium]